MSKPALQLSLQQPCALHRSLLKRSFVARCLRVALPEGQASATSIAQLAVRVVDAEEGRALNHQYRGKDYATNVLTFDYSREPLLHADIVLCAPVLQAEAEAQGLALAAHYAHLLVHGALHAQGFDHERAADARRMQALEVQCLHALGYANPYAR
jgi:probable rRNA maturation factor